MGFAEELERANELGTTREAIAAYADIAERALAVSDLETVAEAKQREVQDARMLGMHQHAVVVTAEAVELWPRFEALAERPEGMEGNLAWLFKHGAGSAMDVPEIPLATVRELLGMLETMLNHFGRSLQAVWELDARLAYIEADDARLRAQVERLTPVLGRWNHIESFADCPACTLTSFVGYLGPDPDAEMVDAVLEPLLAKRPFPADAGHQMVLNLMFGEDPACDNAQVYMPIVRARAYARGGRVAEARAQAELAVGGANPASREMWLRAQVARLEAALAAKDDAEMRAAAEVIDAALPPVEDPYEQLEAIVALHRATPSASLRGRALDLARRIDARLAAPRHRAETERRLDAPLVHSS